MKKLVVMSDNHGDRNAPQRVKELEPQADYYIHLGDSQAYDPSELEGYISVLGNTDLYLDLPDIEILEVENHRILITHGQRYSRFNFEGRMINHLKELECTMLLSGHTHLPHYIEEEGYYLINPGSTSRPRNGLPSYCVVTIDGSDVDVEFKDYYEN